MEGVKKYIQSRTAQLKEKQIRTGDNIVIPQLILELYAVEQVVDIEIALQRAQDLTATLNKDK